MFIVIAVKKKIDNIFVYINASVHKMSLATCIFSIQINV